MLKWMSSGALGFLFLFAASRLIASDPPCCEGAKGNCEVAAKCCEDSTACCAEGTTCCGAQEGVCEAGSCCEESEKNPLVALQNALTKLMNPGVSANVISLAGDSKGKRGQITFGIHIRKGEHGKPEIELQCEGNCPASSSHCDKTESVTVVSTDVAACAKDECGQEQEVVACEHIAPGADVCFVTEPSATESGSSGLTYTVQGLELPPPAPPVEIVAGHPTSLESAQVTVSVSELMELVSEKARCEASLEMVEALLESREEVARVKEELYGSMLKMQSQNLEGMINVVRHNAKLEAELSAALEVSRHLRTVNEGLVQHVTGTAKLASATRPAPMGTDESLSEFERKLQAQNAYMLGVIQELHQNRAGHSKSRPMPVPFASSVYGLERVMIDYAPAETKEGCTESKCESASCESKCEGSAPECNSAVCPACPKAPEVASEVKSEVVR